MKNYIISIYFGLMMVSFSQSWHKDCERSGSTWHEKWTKTLDSIENYPLHERAVILGAAVRIGSSNQNSERAEIFSRSQRLLLDIPGHAQYIVAEVERNRKEEEHLPRGNQTSYDREREWLIGETLSHLPSPETIQVLGDYLDDERDPPPKIVFLPANSFLACVALSEIGLRDPPVSSRPGIHNWREEQVKQKAWHAKVKAGIIPFSFVGQKVEYRFKPDGTWETIAMVNPPDDRPKHLQVAVATEDRKPKKQRPSESDVTSV